MTRLAIAAPNAVAADAAEQTARAGGTAVDAALAAALVVMVTEVGLVSPSSGGFVTVQPTDGGAYCVDGWMDVPGRDGVPADPEATWDIHTAYTRGIPITIGPGSVAVHGSLPALGEAHARDGRLPWREIVAPAIDVARGGHAIGSASRYYLGYVHELIFGWDPASHAVLHDADGELRTHVTMPDLVATLETVAAVGPRALHDGDLARAITDDVRARGGLLGPADLAAYAPVVRPALATRTGAWTLATTPPPSIGGVCVAAMLRLLDGATDGPPDADLTERVQRAVLGHRLDVLDVSDDVAADAARLLALADGGLGALESGSTAHVSVSDGDGAACAVTVSSGYSSGMIAAGTGVWLNNGLGEQELNPRGPQATPPGTRLLSNMAPTVGRSTDGATLAVGSPGADRISTAVAQVLAAFVAGEGLQAAVDRPRLHVHRAGRPEESVRHETEPTMYFGGVGATLLHPDGRLEAAADPRRDGVARVVG